MERADRVTAARALPSRSADAATATTVLEAATVLRLQLADPGAGGAREPDPPG
jgi:hypothetical protein